MAELMRCRIVVEYWFAAVYFWSVISVGMMIGYYLCWLIHSDQWEDNRDV